MTCGDDRRDRQEQGGTDKDKEGPNDLVMTDDPGDHYSCTVTIPLCANAGVGVLTSLPYNWQA